MRYIVVLYDPEQDNGIQDGSWKFDDNPQIHFVAFPLDANLLLSISQSHVELTVLMNNGGTKTMTLPNAVSCCIVVHHMGEHRKNKELVLEIESKDGGATVWKLGLGNENGAQGPNGLTGSLKISPARTDSVKTIYNSLSQNPPACSPKLKSHCRPAGGPQNAIGYWKAVQQPSPGRRPSSEADSAVIWIFGSHREDEAFARGVFNTWYPENVLFVRFADRTAPGDPREQVLELLRREVKDNVTVLFHGDDSETREALRDAGEVLPYTSADERYGELLGDLETIAKNSTNSFIAAKLTKKWVKHYRTPFTRDWLAYFRHRVVNMFAPLSVTAQELTELVDLQDVSGFDRRLRELAMECETRPWERPTAVLEQARRFLFGEGRGPGPIDSGQRPVVELSAVATLTEWRDSLPGDFRNKVWKHVVSHLGSNAKHNRWERGSWIARYCRMAERLARDPASFHRVLFGDRDRGAGEIVAWLVNRGFRDHQDMSWDSLSSWLTKLSRTLRLPKSKEE